MILFISILSVLYALLVLLLLISWEKIPLYPDVSDSDKRTKISLIIAVRNEELSILQLLQDLNHQDYPFENFEVLVVDDFSTDATAEKVRSFNSRYTLKLLSLPESLSETANKKAAIAKGIGQSTGDLIVTTDGDCRVGERWLSSVEYVYYRTGAKMICGPVTFTPSGNIFKEMQVIEFGSLIGTGAATLNAGYPTMCNGANLAYEKKAFYEVGGFSDNEIIPSGDDEFLMHKFYLKYKGKVTFLKSADAIVTTDAKESLKEFVNQRKRWASKWGFYKVGGIRLLAFFIFLFNASLLTFLVLVILGYYPPILFLEQLLIKICIEFVFLRRVQRFFNRKIQFLTFCLLQLLHPFYVTFFGFTSLSGKYEWKGRKLKSLKIDRPGI